MSRLSRVVRGIRQPSRVWRRAQKHRERRQVESARWEERDGFRRRIYDDYGEYVAHQGAKLGKRSNLIEGYNSNLRDALIERLDRTQCAGLNVLCLAARLGGEVEAFRHHGAFAVGIDLNPGPDNPFVLHGDFHDLQFPDNSVDVAFTNSVDHSLDVARLAAEVRRVLRANGTFIIEAMDFAAKPPGAWEVAVWETDDDLVAAIESAGFALTNRQPIDQPWAGVQLQFRDRVETGRDEVSR